jgi:CyaY protein
MITLTFGNRQPDRRQFAEAACMKSGWRRASGGYHFKFDGTHWMDTKGQGEFFARLSRDASEQAGVALVFSA